jgi:hypothetical protein
MELGLDDPNASYTIAQSCFASLAEHRCITARFRTVSWSSHPASSSWSRPGAAAPSPPFISELLEGGGISELLLAEVEEEAQAGATMAHSRCPRSGLSDEGGEWNGGGKKWLVRGWNGASVGISHSWMDVYFTVPYPNRGMGHKLGWR